MDDTAIRNKLDGITLLLVLTVSLLSGLAFGADPGERVVVTGLSLVAVTLLLFGVSYVQPSETA